MSSKKNNSVSVIVSNPKVLNCSNCFELLTIPLYKVYMHFIISTCCHIWCGTYVRMYVCFCWLINCNNNHLHILTSLVITRGNNHFGCDFAPHCHNDLRLTIKYKILSGYGPMLAKVRVTLQWLWVRLFWWFCLYLSHN